MSREIWTKEHFAKIEEKEQQILQLQAEVAKLQALWVTVNTFCNPPDDCNDPVVLKWGMKACIDRAREYEALKEKQDG